VTSANGGLFFFSHPAEAELSHVTVWPKCLDRRAFMSAAKLRVQYDADPAAIAPEVRAALSQYAFYHNIELVPGIKTQGIPWTDLYVLPYLEVCAKFDFYGKRILDVGCGDGVASLAAERLGAAEIYSLDNSYSPGLVNFIIPFADSIIKPVEANLYDLHKLGLGTFDLVLCAGLLYHLQFPFWGLRAIRDAMNPGAILILETAFIEAFEDLPILVYSPGESSFYGPQSPVFYNLAGLRSGLSQLGFGTFKMQHTMLHGANEAEISKKFPAFAKRFGNVSSIRTGRVILTCKKLAGYCNPLFDFFEKTHPHDGSWIRQEIEKCRDNTLKQDDVQPDTV
jgi:SAM-dependent methyltransferase